MEDSIGKVFVVTTWGESHEKEIGAKIKGCPTGVKITRTDIQREMDRRKPGQSSISSQRKEEDNVKIVSGIKDDITTGDEIELLIRNKDARSEDYADIKDVFRPGHGDYTFHMRYGMNDFTGGGRYSGRETAARVAAGAVAKKFLESKGITIIGFTRAVGYAKVKDKDIDYDEIERNPVRCPSKRMADKMAKKIYMAKKSGDSMGGIVEVHAKGVPIGLGEPVFNKLDADLAKALMSIGAVKGVEVGAGFESSLLKGSENNDQMDRNGFLSNNAGGILAGLSSGQDIILRIAVKPTPSISKRQKTVGIDNIERSIEIKGRHDSCICPRIVPVAEAMVAITLADHLLRKNHG